MSSAGARPCPPATPTRALGYASSPGYTTWSGGDSAFTDASNGFSSEPPVPTCTFELNRCNTFVIADVNVVFP